MNQALVCRGVREGRGRETDAAVGEEWGQTRCSARQRPWKALGLTQLGVLRVSSVAVLGDLCTPGGQSPGHLGASSGCELPPQARFREREKWRLAFLQEGIGSAGGLGPSQSLGSLLGLESVTLAGLGSALEWGLGSRLEMAAGDWG